MKTIKQTPVKVETGFRHLRKNEVIKPWDQILRLTRSHILSGRKSQGAWFMVTHSIGQTVASVMAQDKKAGYSAPCLAVRRFKKSSRAK